VERIRLIVCGAIAIAPCIEHDDRAMSASPMVLTTWRQTEPGPGSRGKPALVRACTPPVNIATREEVGRRVG
jgi:hypothetical protein